MKNWLAGLDKRKLSLIREIGRAADLVGCPAFVVGGFVRDIILKRVNLDLDVVIEGDAIRFAKMLTAKMNAALVTHQQFGTATITLSNGLRVDLATARKETYPASGALPVVAKGSIQDDLFRRDFTINALAVRIDPGRFGELRDDFGGMDDIRGKTIKVLHDQSFIDDPTRILRAVRFEQRFGFGIEPRTLFLLKSAIKKGVVANVKLPRYFAEFRKALSEPAPARCLDRLYHLGGLKFLGQDLKCDGPTLKLLDSVKANVNWLQSQLPVREIDSWLIYFMVLISQLPIKSVGSVLGTLHLREIDREKILSCRGALRMVPKLAAAGLKPSGVYRILKPLSYETILFLRAQVSVKIIRQRMDDFILKYESVKLDVSGEDLKGLGIPAGRRMGQIMEQLLYQKIDGCVRSRHEELSQVEKWKR